jgi:hypothetical protein
MRTRRVATSMTNSTYKRLWKIVSTVKNLALLCGRHGGGIAGGGSAEGDACHRVELDCIRCYPVLAVREIEEA